MRTAQQIVDQTNELARLLASVAGWRSPIGHKFHEGISAREKTLWEQACEAQRLLTNTCPNDALSDIEEDASDISKLYYEAHITIEPVFDEQRETAAKIAEKFGFKLADLLMKKREEDTEQRSSKDTFMTGHSKSFEDIKVRTIGAVSMLELNKFKVWRYKIEDTLVDSKAFDEFSLLK